MASLLTPEQFQQVDDVINDVTDTFMNTPIILKYQLHNNEDTFGRIGASQHRWLTIPVYALVNSKKDGEVSVGQEGRAGNTMRKYTVATKDYVAALTTAINAYNTNPADGIPLAAPDIEVGVPINYVDSTRIVIEEAPWGSMRAHSVAPVAVWGQKDSQQHKLLCIYAEEQPYKSI